LNMSYFHLPTLIYINSTLIKYNSTFYL
jgi:hypothetical protein